MATVAAVPAGAPGAGSLIAAWQASKEVEGTDDQRLMAARSTDGGATWQGLTPVHFSAQLEPCLTQENTLNTLNTPSHPLNTGYTTPTRTPYPIQSAQVELKGGRV